MRIIKRNYLDKRLIFSLRLGLFLLLSQSISAQPFVFITSDDSTIRRVNIQNCDSKLIGKTGIRLEDIAYCPNRKFYGIFDTDLYEINETTAKTTKVLTIQGSNGYVGLVCDSSNILYAASSIGNLLEINPLNFNYSITGFYKQGCEGDISFLHDSLYIAAPGGELYFDSTRKGTMSSTSHVNGLASLFYGNTLGLPHVLVSTQHISIWITSPKNGYSSPLCSNISKSCIRGATASNDTLGYSFTTTLLKYLIETEIEMPNVFSPNQDNYNDRFVPIKYKGPFANATLEITNRWGTSIFKTNDILKGWDGSQTGMSEAPDGIYYWVLTYGLNESLLRAENIFKPKTLKGYVQLKR